MKKKTKNLLVLVAVLVLLIGGYFALELIPEDTGEEEDTVTETIEVTEFSREDIASYSYYNSAYEIGFEVTEDGYAHWQDELFPVNATGVEAQLTAVGDLTALQVVDGTDKSEYGLDSPQVTIALTLKDGTERTFFIGDSALFEAADYLLDVENNIIYLIEETLYSKFTYDWTELVEKEEFSKPTTDQILDVTVETAGVETFSITYDETKEQPWQLTTTEGTFDGDSDAVLDAIGAFDSYIVKATVEYNCSDFSQYGLEEPVTKVTVHYTEADEAVAEDTEAVAGETKTLTFEFGNVDSDADVAYVRINGSSFVYTMSEYYSESVSVFDLETLKYQPEEVTEDTAETTTEE